MLSDFIGLAVLLSLVGCAVYTQVPRHWQGVMGFLIITFGWVPAGFLAICIAKEPAVLIPAALILGLLAIGRRAS
jgi:hypothetical protein